MTPSTLALARRVRALLEAPERWTQGAFWRDAAGRHEGGSGDSPAAVCWCLYGAMNRVAGGQPTSADWIRFRDQLRAALGCGDLVKWNDTPGRTHADVLALLDRVIAEGER